MTIHTDAAIARDEQITTINAAITAIIEVQTKQAEKLADLQRQLDDLVVAPPAPPPAPPAPTDYAIGCPWGTSLLTNQTLGQSHSNSCDASATTFVANDTAVNAVRLFHIYTSKNDGYSLGDGGTVAYEIFKWDVASGKPVGPALGSTPDIVANTRYWTQAQAAAKYPGAIWVQHGETSTGLYHFRKIDFKAPVQTTPGECYAVIVRQTNADKANHHIAIDMLRNRRQWLGGMLPGIDGERDFLVYQLRGDEWVFRSGGKYERQGLTGIIGIYGPNRSKAQPYYQTSSQIPDPDRAANVDGKKAVRMRFTPAEAFTLGRVHVSAGRNSGTGPLTLTLAQGGTTILTANLNGYPRLTQPSDTFANLHEQVDWQSQDGLSVPIKAGVEVIAMLTTDPGNDFEIVSTQDGGNSYFASGGWPNSLMEYTDDGNAWEPASVSKIGLMFVGKNWV